MDINYFRLLFGYNRWANTHILDRAAELSPEKYVEPVPGLSMGNIAGVLAHTLGTEIFWVSRYREESPTTILSVQDLPTFASLRERWEQQEEELAAYLNTLKDEDVERMVTYQRREEEFTQPLGHMFAHVVNHGTQFRAEAAVALTAFGHSPGDIDLIFYLRSPGVA